MSYLSTNLSELNKEVITTIGLTSQEFILMKPFEVFNNCCINEKIFCDILNSNSIISIRLIDYFITKYAKNNKISFNIIEKNIESSINVFLSYKQQLKIFKKKYFDPFSRGNRIPYFMDNNCIITTIGQLNFFKWFFQKKIYDYILNNKKTIETVMNIKPVPSLKSLKIDKKQLQSINIINKYTYNYKHCKKNKLDKIIVSFN